MLGQNIIVKVILVAIIIFLFLNYLVPGLPFYVRSNAYQFFQLGAKAVLNYHTRHFYTVESENFTLKYSEKDQDIALFAAEVAERYYDSVKQYLDYNLEEEKILVVIYPDQKSLNRSFGWAGDKSAAGVYWAGNIRLLSSHAWDPDEDSAEKTREILERNIPLSHELTHLLVDRQTGGNYTRWLTEGLAQYIEEKVAGFRLDEPLPAEKEKLYSLAQLDRDFDKQENQLLVYWQSLQTVQCLIDNYGMEKMQELLLVLGQNIKTEQAIARVYGLSISELENETRDYIRVNNK